MGRPRRAGGRDRAADGSMPLVEHLYELRSRLRTALLALLVGMIVAFVFRQPIVNWVVHPYCQLPRSRVAGLNSSGTVVAHCQVYTFGVLDPFTQTLKVVFLAGLLGSSPLWLYQVWAFITPGLHKHEQRWAMTFVAASVGLFAAGTVLAYLTLAHGLDILLGFAGNNVTALLTFSNYLSYFQSLIIVFGLGFEFPLLLVMLNVVGVLPAARMRRWWRGMVFGIFLFAGVATPDPSPWTMSILAVILIVLFWAAVGVSALLDRRKAVRQEAQDQAMADELGVPVEEVRAPEFVDT